MMKALRSRHWPLQAEPDRSSSQSALNKSPSNVAAIDFGTTYSSLVYKTEGDEQITCLKLNSTFERVPTAILLKVINRSHDTVEYEVRDYGMRALIEYGKLKESDRRQHIYFERIKMTLQHDEEVNRNMQIKDFHGDSYYLMEVIAIMLKYLKDQLIDHLSRTIRPLLSSDFEWVITVPAIWRSRGRHMMREAAYLAGLCSDGRSISELHFVTERGLRKPDFSLEHLTLCLEPEVAAIYCQRISGDDVASYAHITASTMSTRYMVLDIGGGTVDITAQKIEGGVIEVIDIPTGSDWGGTRVNREFENLLEDLVNDPQFTRFLKSDPAKSSTHLAVLNQLIYKEFEDEKVKFGERHAKGDMSTGVEEAKISIPRKFIQFYGEDVLTDGAKRLHRFQSAEFGDDTLYMKYNDFEKLFQPAVDSILKSTVDALGRLDRRIDTIYLVGGFGGCKYMHSQIREAVDEYDLNRYLVIAPTHHKLAVAHGAVMYRLNPCIVHSRRADATYGLSVSVPFNSSLHDQHYLYYDEDGVAVCRYAFLTFVRRGEKLTLGDKYKALLQPEIQNQRDFVVSIYSTHDPTLLYTKDKDNKDLVTKVGEVAISLPEADFLHKDQRQFEALLEFSGTEIQAEIVYLDAKLRAKVPIDFLSSHVL